MGASMISSLRILGFAFIFIFGICSFAGCAPIDPASGNAKPVVPEIAAAGYQLAFSDEFNGTALDTNKWDYRTDSKALSTQLPENVTVSDGSLHLLLKKETAHGKNYTGGGVISKQLFKYGYYEARFRIPSGAGWHTSFWTQKQDGSEGTGTKAATQEIDICEQNSRNPAEYSTGVRNWLNKGKSYGQKYLKTSDLSTDFHIWSCEFTPTVVKFFFDGKLTHLTDATLFPHGDQNIWLTSIGYTKVDDLRLPAVADFDYVRYYAPPNTTSPK